MFKLKLQTIAVIEGIKRAWNSLKMFFVNLWKQITPKFSEWLKPIKNLWSGTKNLSSKIGNFFGGTELTAATPANKLPTQSLQKSYKNDGSRNQNNSFSITINAAKNDNAEAIANKVTNRISDFSKTFLFDPVPEVI